MTIAAAYLTWEGVVLGADSTTTYMFDSPPDANGKTEKLERYLNHAQKVFEIGDGGSLGLATYGLAHLGDLSHRTICARLADSLTPKCSVKDAAGSLAAMLKVAMAPLASSDPNDAQSLQLGYFIGGTNIGDRTPSCFEIQAFGDGSVVVREMQLGEVTFRGFPNFFTRVFYGVDGPFLGRLHKELKDRLTPTDAAAFDTAFLEALKATSAAFAPRTARPPIREAIDYVFSMLHLTIKSVKHLMLPPICGGPIEVAFISTDRPFRWVNHKDFGTAVAEQELRQ